MAVSASSRRQRAIAAAAGGHTEWFRGAEAELAARVAALRLRGYRVHPLQGWLRAALVERADRLREWTLAQLPVEELDGLAGQAIPLEARIVAVADVFDALTSERPYKKPWSNARACAELERLSGSKLDPDCVAALLRSPREIEEIQRSFAD